MFIRFDFAEVSEVLTSPAYGNPRFRAELAFWYLVFVRPCCVTSSDFHEGSPGSMDQIKVFVQVTWVFP